MGLNTKIEYLYRDAGNWKQYNECVINGVLTPEQIETILGCCNDELFIPRKVGLPEKRFEKWTEDDHIWFEFNDWDECFSETTEPATVDITPVQLVEAFLSCKEKWEDEISVTLVEAIERTDSKTEQEDYAKEANAPVIYRFVNNEECALALFEYLKDKGSIAGTEYDRETILHDINNLRGREWLEVLERNITTKPFFEYINGAEYPYDEFIYGSGVAPEVFLKAVLDKDFPENMNFDEVRDVLDKNGYQELWDYPTDELGDVLDNFNENFDENIHLIAVDFYDNGGYFARIFEITQEMADRFESFLVQTERGDTVLPCHVRPGDRITGPYKKSINDVINNAKQACENVNNKDCPSKGEDGYGK